MSMDVGMCRCWSLGQRSWRLCFWCLSSSMGGSQPHGCFILPQCGLFCCLLHPSYRSAQTLLLLLHNGQHVRAFGAYFTHGTVEYPARRTFPARTSELHP